MFGPASKLVALSTERPASATARPLSATGRASRAESGRTSALETGRTSRAADEPARRRLSSMPRPSPAPRRSVGGRTALSPQKSTPRTTPTRRPPSTLPPLPPASFSQDDSFVFDEPPPRPPTAAPDDLLEQLALPSAAPLAEARRELAEARAASAEQRARAAERELELEETRRRELADEARRREALEQRVAELQRQLTEALDTATSAADAHEALEQRAAAHGERVLDLEAALAAAQLRDEHRPDDESDASRELALLHTRIEQMMTAWNRERSELVERTPPLGDRPRESRRERPHQRTRDWPHEPRRRRAGAPAAQQHAAAVARAAPQRRRPHGALAAEEHTAHDANAATPQHAAPAPARLILPRRLVRVRRAATAPAHRRT